MLFISTVFAHSLPTGCSEEPNMKTVGSSLESVGDQRIEKYGNKRICRVDMEPLTYVMYAS